VRILASIEALLLVGAAIGYAAGSLGLLFMAYLAAMNWQWLALTGVSALAATASAFLAFKLLASPSPVAMIVGFVLLVPAAASVLLWLSGYRL
jgi:hypothetical protein